MRRLADLTKTVKVWRSLEKRAASAAELAALGDDSLDGELQEEAAKIARELDELELAAAFHGKYDGRNAILSIHAGAGGTESQDWARMLMRMYLRWGERRGYRVEVLDTSPGDITGLKTAVLGMFGEHAYGYLKSEHGVHRLVRLSPYDADHARHTSFVLVEVMPEAESDVEVNIEPTDLRWEAFRSSGPGGQNMQKTSTAVRLIHQPSGLTVTCQSERSQRQNREIALTILRSRLLARQRAAQAEERAKIKGKFVAAGWSNQIRSYILHPYKMVKDHRTDVQVNDADAVLDGDLDVFVDAYLRSRMGESDE